jgi:hypothetical protein
MDDVRSGTRLKCQTCGSEAVVTKGATAAPICCGQPLTVTAEPKGR